MPSSRSTSGTLNSRIGQTSRPIASLVPLTTHVCQRVGGSGRHGVEGYTMRTPRHQAALRRGLSGRCRQNRALQDRVCHRMTQQHESMGLRQPEQCQHRDRHGQRSQYMLHRHTAPGPCLSRLQHRRRRLRFQPRAGPQQRAPRAQIRSGQPMATTGVLNQHLIHGQREWAPMSRLRWYSRQQSRRFRHQSIRDSCAQRLQRRCRSAHQLPRCQHQRRQWGPQQRAPRITHGTGGIGVRNIHQRRPRRRRMSLRSGHRLRHRQSHRSQRRSPNRQRRWTSQCRQTGRSTSPPTIRTRRRRMFRTSLRQA